MMYPYIILPDNTEITHSHLIERDDIEMVEVHFERPKQGGVFRPDVRHESHCDDGAIAIDASTSHSDRVNGPVLEDERTPVINISDDEKIDLVAAQILERHKGAFLELAK